MELTLQLSSPDSGEEQQNIIIVANILLTLKQDNRSLEDHSQKRSQRLYIYQTVPMFDEPRRKKQRTVFTEDQLSYLLEQYRWNKTPCKEVIEDIADELKLSTDTVRNWFSNKRGRDRRDRKLRLKHSIKN